MLLAGAVGLYLSACQLIAGLEEKSSVGSTSSPASCLLNSDCAADDVCIFATCSVPCNEDVDCEQGARCLRFGERRACVSSASAECANDRGCPSGTTCSSGACRTPCSVAGDGDGGHLCNTDQICRAGSCIGTTPGHDPGAQGQGAGGAASGGSPGGGSGGAAAGGTAGSGGTPVAGGAGGAPPDGGLDAGAGGAGTGGAGTGGAGTGGAGAGGAGAGGAGAGGAGPRPAPGVIPESSGPCPTLAEGTITVANESVRLWMADDGETLLGPVVIYWHATASSPNEATFGLGAAAIAEVKDLGGMVIAMQSGTGTGTNTGNGTWHTGDFAVVEEVLACAIETGVGIDTARIHTMGLSAGAMQAAYMLKSRNGYIASAAYYSGTLAFSVAYQDALRRPPVMMFHGGDSDVVGLNFKDATLSTAATLKTAGHFVIVCDHGTGHRVPAAPGPAGAWAFLKAHPFGVDPEPYQGGLPGELPAYCVIH